MMWYKTLSSMFYEIGHLKSYCESPHHVHYSSNDHAQRWNLLNSHLETGIYLIFSKKRLCQPHHDDYGLIYMRHKADVRRCKKKQNILSSRVGTSFLLILTKSFKLEAVGREEKKQR